MFVAVSLLRFIYLVAMVILTLFVHVFWRFLMSKYRKPLSRRRSRKQFSKSAKYVHPKNGMSRPMRGGIRL